MNFGDIYCPSRVAHNSVMIMSLWRYFGNIANYGGITPLTAKNAVFSIARCYEMSAVNQRNVGWPAGGVQNDGVVMSKITATMSPIIWQEFYKNTQNTQLAVMRKRRY